MPEIVESGDPARIISFVEEMDRSDRENQKIIAEILASGWPENLSRKANSAIFLVVDHANLDYQKQYRPLLEDAAERGIIPKSNWATLEDRILMGENKKQIYGTQTKAFLTLSEGKSVYYMWPIEDAGNVDARRQEIGLPPLAEYLEIMESYMGQPVIWEPELSVEELLKKGEQ